MQPIMLDFLFGATCDKCNRPTMLQSISFRDYFFGEGIECRFCEEKINLYRMYVNTIKENFMLNDAYKCIGAKQNVFTIELTPEEIFNLDFTDYGIPVDAEILQVNYFPQGGALFPNEFHGNTPQFKKYYQNKINLYPAKMNLEKKQEVENTKVSVSVTWIHTHADNHAFSNLITTFENYVRGYYKRSIIPANVVVEERLEKYMMKKLMQSVSKNRINRFLMNGATYSHQINVLLPTILNYENKEMLSDQIRGKLNELRKLRNQIAHEGRSSSELTKSRCAELICASLFGYVFINILLEDLD